jgi:8-oxo-dGTP pyrophosphatase MutT (NUDIX family)
VKVAIDKPTFALDSLPGPFYRVSLKAIVFDDQQRLLMVQVPEGLWEVPGGGWEHDEDLLLSLRREFKEELGIDDITVGEPYFVYRGLNERGYHMLRIALPVTVHDRNFSYTTDTVAAKFVTQAELLELPMADDEAPIKQHVDKIWPLVEKTA